MKNAEIQFRATTIAPKRSIDDTEMPIGSYKATVYGMLTYLDQCGIELTRQTLYKAKGQEYCVPKEKCNNPVADWMFRDRMEYCRINGASLHIKIERL
jgi:hypothetical protein